MLALDQVLHLFLVIQTLIFALILFSFRNISSNSNKILAYYMLAAFLQFSLNAFELFQYYNIAVIGYYVIIPLMLCNAPILFLYIKVLTDPKFKIKWTFIIHFIPSILVLIFNFYSFGNISLETKLNILTQNHKGIGPADSYYLNLYLNAYYFVSHYFYNIQILFYSGLMIFRLRFHQKNIYSIFSYKENISLNWLRIFVLSFLLISFYEVIFYDYASDLYLLILNLYFLFLGFFGIKQTDIYYGRLKYSELQQNEEDVQNANSVVTENETLASAGVVELQSKKFKISEEQIEEYIQTLNLYLEKEKPFLNSKLNLPDLAEMTNIPRNTLSMLINETYNKNFFNFINELRIIEAQKRLLDPTFDNLSIEGLAKGVGFNSKSVFNPAFKKYTGKTPLEFKKTKV